MIAPEKSRVKNPPGKIGGGPAAHNRRKIPKTFAVQSLKDEKDCICWDKFVTMMRAPRDIVCYSGAWL
jgi:hypothetical protein